MNLGLSSLPSASRLLGRHRGLAALLVVEVALGVWIAFLAWHAGFAYRQALSAPSGIAEAELLVVPPMAGGAGSEDPAALVEALRTLPGVRGAVASNQSPYLPNSWNTRVSERWPVKRDLIASVYLSDSTLAPTLGARRVQGRDLRPSEVRGFRTGQRERNELPVLVTEGLARRLYPGRSALGQPIIGFPQPLRIVGVIARLPQPTGSRGRADPEASLILPLRPDDLSWSSLLVRTAPAQREAVADRLAAWLAQRYPDRVIGRPQPLDRLRHAALHGERRWAATLIACALGWWILTLASLAVAGYLWVQQGVLRISLHRAFGASRAQVRRAIHCQHLLLSLMGVAVGGATLLSLSPRLPASWAGAPASWPWLLCAALAIAALAQVAAFWPARRAAGVPPERVTRKPWVRL